MATSRRAGLRRRRLRLASVLLSVPVLVLVIAGPALAAGQPDSGSGDIGDAHSPAPQSLPVMLGLYVGIPLAGFVIAILLSLRSGKKSDRYRPGRPWEHDAAWFGSSADKAQQVQDERHRAALPGSGGASGRW